MGGIGEGTITPLVQVVVVNIEALFFAHCRIAQGAKVLVQILLLKLYIENYHLARK
jgi:hypothetical protein